MKKTVWSIAMGACAALVPLCAQAQKVEFWMGDGKASVDSFMAHKGKIDVISPTWYQFDEDGMVTGEPQPVVLFDHAASQRLSLWLARPATLEELRDVATAHAPQTTPRRRARAV